MMKLSQHTHPSFELTHQLAGEMIPYECVEKQTCMPERRHLGMQTRMLKIGAGP